MRRALSYGFVSAALALAGAWVVAQLDLNVFQPGEVISSQEMNANFQRVEGALGAKQARVTGTCAPGSSIRVVHADGTVDCEPDDTAAGGGESTVATDGTLRGDGRSEAPLGIAAAASGETYGLYGETASPQGYAAWGRNDASGAFGYLAGEWGAYGAHGDGDTAGMLGTADAGVEGLGFRGALAGRFDGDVLVDGNLLVSGTVDPPSSRSQKEALRPVDREAVLDMLATAPIRTGSPPSTPTGWRSPRFRGSTPWCRSGTPASRTSKCASRGSKRRWEPSRDRRRGTDRKRRS